MAKKTLAIEAKQYTEFAGKSEAMSFIKRSYMVVGVGFLASAIIYPWAVRIVKSIFGFKNFFNIHFV